MSVSPSASIDSHSDAWPDLENTPLLMTRHGSSFEFESPGVFRSNSVKS